MDRREHQFDGPFRGKPFGLQRVGKTKATDCQVRALCAGAVKLAVHILAFGQHRDGRQQIKVRAKDVAVQIGRAHFQGRHAAFAGQKAGQRNFKLAVGEEEQGAVPQRCGLGRNGFAGARTGGFGSGPENGVRHAEFVSDGPQPKGRAFFTKGEGGRNVARAPAQQCLAGVGQEGLGQGENRVRPDGRHLAGPARGQHADRGNAHRRQQRQRLIFHHIGQRANQQQFARLCGGKHRDHGGQAGILALREGRLDARAGEVQHPHVRRVPRSLPLGGLRKIQLDHLGRAGADQEQLPDIGAAGQQAVHFAVQLGLGIGQPGQILFLKDRRAEAGFGKDHHPGCGLQQMGTGAAAHYQKEGILHLAVQPDDSRQAAEHLALAALAQNRQVAAAAGGERAHAATSASSRARRSLYRNWPALMT